MAVVSILCEDAKRNYFQAEVAKNQTRMAEISTRCPAAISCWVEHTTLDVGNKKGPLTFKIKY